MDTTSNFVIFLTIICSLNDATNKATTGPFVITFDPLSLPIIKVFFGNVLLWHTSFQNSSLLMASKTRQTVIQNGGDFVIKNLVLEECNHAEFKEMKVVHINAHSQRIIISGYLCNLDPVTMLFEAVTSAEGYSHLLFNLTFDSDHYNELKLIYGCEQDEQFYGLGVQYTYFNMRGHSVPLFVSEQGVGRGLEPVTFMLDVLSPGAGKCSFV